MITIRNLLLDESCEFFDDHLTWGTSATVYNARIQNALEAGRTPVLVELNVQDFSNAASVVIVDHHRLSLTGADQPCSLEQIFQLLDLPTSRWTRNFDLVAANDVGHIREMRALSPPATDREIESIRQQDRDAQGVMAEEVGQARQDALQVRCLLDGLLTFSQTTLHRSGLIAEYLDPFYGGPGFNNLLVQGPKTWAFWGVGRLVERLAMRSPKDQRSWWCGGKLSGYGFWGGVATELDFDPVSVCTGFLMSSD